jgi:hypothetical protein
LSVSNFIIIVKVNHTRFLMFIIWVKSHRIDFIIPLLLLYYVFICMQCKFLFFLFFFLITFFIYSCFCFLFIFLYKLFILLSFGICFFFNLHRFIKVVIEIVLYWLG